MDKGPDLEVVALRAKDVELERRPIPKADIVRCNDRLSSFDVMASAERIVVVLAGADADVDNAVYVGKNRFGKANYWNRRDLLEGGAP